MTYVFIGIALVAVGVEYPKVTITGFLAIKKTFFVLLYLFLGKNTPSKATSITALTCSVNQNSTTFGPSLRHIIKMMFSVNVV